MSLEYFDEVIKELRKYIADKNIQICMMTLVSVCELIIGITDLVDGKIAFGVTSCILAVIGFVLTAFLFKDISEKMERKIEFLKHMYDVDQKYKKIDEKASEEEKEILQQKVLELARKLNYGKRKTLDEILEEVDGDTKECECELDEGDTMS